MTNKDSLKRVHQANRDEREDLIKLKAFHIGWLSVTGVMLFLIIFRSLYNESASDIIMILMAQTAAVSFYQYVNLRDKRGYLYTGIISTIAVFLSLAALLSEYGVY